MTEIARIRCYLAERNIHQYQLAKQLGVTETHLSKVLRNRAKPSSQLLGKLETILKEKREGGG